MLMLIYDFETNGLPLFSEPSDDPRQPHIVQVGACLVDVERDFEVVSSIDMIVQPTDWIIPDDVAAVHGITTERAKQVGVREQLALDALLSLWQQSSARMGHNEVFDARIARIAIKRFLNEGIADEWKRGKSECTARLSTSIMKLPPTAKMRAAGRNHPKTPKLSEAYEFFTGKPLENAHSAMADVLGCLEVYRSIKAPKNTEGEALCLKV